RGIPRWRGGGAQLGGGRGGLARLGRNARFAATRARHLALRRTARSERRAVIAADAHVRPARGADTRALSLVLARAFRDDPVHRWILPGEFDWAIASDAFFAMVMRDMLRNESVFT